MEYTLDELKQQVFQQIRKNVNEVYEVFQHHFKEDYVDIQQSSDDLLIHYCHLWLENGKYNMDETAINTLKEYFNAVIMVWWPQVKVTNENDKFVIINDLYAKIQINGYGCIPMEDHGFRLNRATYSDKQFDSGYLHSHVRGIPKSDFTQFMAPCLGDGPIKNTIVTLKTHNDPVEWMLFCEELSRYVTVESLAGVPYQKLENIGKFTDYYATEYEHGRIGLNDLVRRLMAIPASGSDAKDIDEDSVGALLKDFTLYYLKHGHLVVSFQYGHFVPAMTPYRFMLDISNSFIEYYNKHLAPSWLKAEYLTDWRSSILKKVYSDGHRFYFKGNSGDSRDSSSYAGAHVCTFKGEDITLKITHDNTDNNTVLLLDKKVAMLIFENILKIMNYRFKNNNGNNNSETTTASTKVLYL